MKISITISHLTDITEILWECIHTAVQKVIAEFVLHSTTQPFYYLQQEYLKPQAEYHFVKCNKVVYVTML